MKKIIFSLLILVILFSVFYFLLNKTSTNIIPQNNTLIPSQANREDLVVIAKNLHVPWGIAFLPDKSMLVTERSGTVRLIDNNGQLENQPVANLSQVREVGEGGLLGIALHPNFNNNKYVYLYYTYDELNGNTKNRVSRFTYDGVALQNEKIVVDNIPGASNHNGGRIKFGPDNFLYITTGDAQEPSLAQNRNSLAGKILRVTDAGAPAPGNPFGTAVYSYGHRNPQGIAWDGNGQLWSTEHGRSGITSGLDELNLIQVGKNYGWPDIEGNQQRTGMESPRVNSGADVTWAPAGATIIYKVIYFGGLRGSSLYTADLSQNPITVKEHFKDQFGRIRDVVAGSDNMLYITTSNTDGRGTPKENDDKIIRIDPTKIN